MLCFEVSFVSSVDLNLRSHFCYVVIKNVIEVKITVPID